MRFVFIQFFCLMLVVLLSSCSVALTKQGEGVREFSNVDPSSNCKFLGIAKGSFGSGLDYAGDREGAMNDLKNNVAKLGGNFFKIQTSTSTGFSTNLTAEVFDCLKNVYSEKETSSSQNFLANELRFLKEAKVKGLISNEQYKQKVQEILDKE